MDSAIHVSTIYNPEFINVTPYNPLISECEIKVLYVGENRNRSYITKEVATEMANSLPGCPIVGYYKEEKEDFGDHGDRVIIDGDGIKFECLTQPYGFVAPDAKVWFQKFDEQDAFGNTITREYLMTTGYLWTGQYEEAQQVLDDGGKPHSMELDEKTLQGNWSENIKNGMEFFIINDAIFSKLCILGDDVEPCFEGSSVTAPNVSKSFTKMDDEFTTTLFKMMDELKFALKGGNAMLDNENVVATPEEEVVASEFAKEDDKEKEKSSEESKKEEKETSDESKEDEDKNKKKDYAKEDEDEDKKPKDDDKEDDEDKKKNFTAEDEGVELTAEFVKEEEKKEEKDSDEDKDADKEKKEEEDKEKEKKYNLLLDKYSALEAKYNELLAFKNSVEKAEKEALIDTFYMLSEEDKADVRTNIDKYTKDDIEAKLSVICVRKKVNFDLEDNSKNQDNIEDVITYNVNDTVNSLPAWVKAVKENE